MSETEGHETRFTAAIKLIRNEAARQIADAYTELKPERADKWLALYRALYATYPDICDEPLVLP